MSKKVTYFLCVILCVGLIALMVCEWQNPEGGMELIRNLLG